MTHDDRRERWNQRHRDGPIESADPNPVLADVVAGWTPGFALDVACGDGANAVWLARREWHVPAIERAETVRRNTPAARAPIDALLVARR